MRKLFTFLIALLMILCMAFPASAAWRDMWAQVYKMDNKTGTDQEMSFEKITTGVMFKVLQAGSDTAETLYYYGKDAFTSLTNPVSTTNYASASVMKAAGVLSFRVDPGATDDVSVDLIVIDTATGFTAFVEDFNANTHKIVIDQRPNIVHHAMTWFDIATSTETDTGIDFVPDTQILAMWIEVITVDANETLDVGILSSQTGGNADGFLDGVSMATAGHVLPTLTTSGALMDDGTNFDPNGEIIDGVAYVSSEVGGGSLTISGSEGIDTADGLIHYLMTRIR